MNAHIAEGPLEPGDILAAVSEEINAPRFSDIIYKWRNPRRTLTLNLAATYRLLREDGPTVTRSGIRRDIQRLFRENFERLK